jgi:hypothetical protein
MEMQRMPVHKAFYEASSLGNRWQMPRCKSTEFAYSVRRGKIRSANRVKCKSVRLLFSG